MRMSVVLQNKEGIYTRCSEMASPSVYGISEQAAKLFAVAYCETAVPSARMFVCR